MTGRRTRPARPRTRGAGPRAGAPVLVERTNHYVIRYSAAGTRLYFREMIMRHGDGTLWRHYVPEEAAA